MANTNSVRPAASSESAWVTTEMAKLEITMAITERMAAISAPPRRSKTAPPATDSRRSSMPGATAPNIAPISRQATVQATNAVRLILRVSPSALPIRPSTAPARAAISPDPRSRRDRNT